MKISADEIYLSIKFNESKNTPKHIPLFLIHGFTGHGNDWNFLHNKLPETIFPVTIDIIGHGKSDSPNNAKFYSEKSLVEQIHTVVKYFGSQKNLFAGYSMGGRLALSYTEKYTDFVSGLILESASPGIEGKTERELRLVNDKKIAESILQNGIKSFINSWINQPFFNSLKNVGEEKLSEIIAERIENNPVGLSNILTEFSQGKMTPKWDLLEKLSIPTLLISGELDKKYCEINKRVGEKIRNAQVEIIKDCGHNVHLEKEEEFINLVSSFLEKYF